MRAVLAAALLAVVVLSVATADTSPHLLVPPSQPFALAYGTADGPLLDYAAPGALVVAGSTSEGRPEFATLARAGTHVLYYLDPVVANPDGRYQALLLEPSACGPAVPLWPGLPRANVYGPVADFRPGGVLQGKLACVLEAMVAEHPTMAGWLADDLGSRSWFPGIDWSRLSGDDRWAWRVGAAALTATFRAVADRHGLLVVVNGTWQAGRPDLSGGGYPDPALDGNALADGTLVEHHDGQAAFFAPYACGPQWARASPVTRGRPVNGVVTRSAAALPTYLATGCFAYGVAQDDYDTLPVPWSGFVPTDLPGSSS